MKAKCSAHYNFYIADTVGEDHEAHQLSANDLESVLALLVDTFGVTYLLSWQESL